LSSSRRSISSLLWYQHHHHAAPIGFGSGTTNSHGRFPEQQQQQIFFYNPLPFGCSSCFHQQVRWKRKDGNKWHNGEQQRRPNKKQRKKYHRHLQTIQAEQDKHGKPGQKAGPRREWNQAARDELLNNNDNTTVDPRLSNDNSYTMGDALLDDLMGNTVQAAPTPEPAYLGHKHRQYFNAVADHMDDYRQYQQQLVLQQQQQQAAVVVVQN
jgi:hypothetical protein